MSDKSFVMDIALIANRNAKEKEYWLNKLAGRLGRTSFPYDFNKMEEWKRDDIDRPLERVEHMEFKVSGGDFEKLMWIANNSDLRLFMILVTGLMVLLGKHTGQEDILVGAPIERQEVEADFLNTLLALRVQLDAGMTFKELLLQVRQVILEAGENQNFPIERIPFELNIDVQKNDTFALFDTAVLLENIHDRNYIAHVQLNMLFSFVRTAESIEGVVEYNSALYKRETIQVITDHFVHLFREIVSNLDIPIIKLNIMPEDEREFLLVRMNDTQVEYPKTTIHELFEIQVEKTPENIAVEEADTGHTMTYKELNRRANRLASLLQEKGVIPGAVVAVMGERTGDIVTSILAILKAGGVFLPLDAQNPNERLYFILEDSGTNIIIFQKRIIAERENLFKEFSPRNIIAMDDDTIYEGGTENPTSSINPSHPAYIIYTSGTTGKPKGVIGEHRSLVNYINFAVNNYVKGESVNFPLYTSIAFDLTITSIFTPLVTGNAVVVYSGWNKGNLIERIVDDNKVGVIKLTPSHLYLIGEKQGADSSHKIKRFVVGGEVLKYQIARDIINNFNGKIDIYNEYGPTEATVGCMLYKFDPVKDYGKGSSVSIGIPASNTQIYLLDKNREPVSMGAIGEIHIGGDGLARGYLNRPELTSEKFLNLSTLTFSKSFCGAFFKKRPAGGYLYRTGDLARWMSDGNIEFLGRIDHQVKIRGFRIELGEIESRLLKHDAVKEAVVTIKEAGGDKHICAYIVTSKKLSNSELRDYLGRQLPDYMVPSYFVEMDAIPLTSNGKVDMHALHEPETKAEAMYVAPRNETEKRLVEIWGEILGLDIEIIGIDANFFELGGHSLSGTVLNAKVHKTFNVKLALVDLFRSPTVRELAQILEESIKIEFIPIEPVEEKEYYPLSSAQKRLYVLQELEQDNNINYNMSFAYSVEGKLDLAKLNSVFKKLIARHESFKTSFEMLDDALVQRIHQDVEFNIETYELQETTIPALTSAFVRAFDLSKAPLLRVGVIKINEDNYILMIDMHHIVSDGVSINIILKDFSALFYDRELPDLAIQYKDYSEWQNTERQKELLKSQEAYWLKKFAGEIPLLSLPTDYARSVVQQFKGNIINFSLDEQLTNKIRELEKTSESTLFILLLSIFNVLLVRYSGQEDIIIGTLTTGRSHIELAGIVGVLLNTLPIRTFPAKNKYFFDYTAEVKKETFDAFENSDYQYDELLEKIRIDRNIGRNPLYDVMLILQNIEMDKELLDDMGLKNFDLERTIALLDIRLVAEEFDTGLMLSLEYSTSLFKPETIRQMIRHMIKIIREVTANPKRKILEYDLLEEEEKNRILNEFNGLKVEFPQDKTIHHYVEACADQMPDHIAVVYEGNQITYHHLNLLANRLAWNSRKLGKTLDHLAIILLDRSLEMVLVIISVWKSGGAYIPIDTQYPINRIQEIIEDSQAGVVISNRRYVTPGVEKELKCEMVFSEEILFASEKEWDSDHPIFYFPTNMYSLSYIIYTSGSTGKPKGVMIEHMGMMNHIHTKIHDLQITGRSMIAQNASHTFDISVWQFFAAFAAGGKTVIFPDKIIMDTGTFIKQIVGHGITLLEVVPSYLTVLLDTMEGQSDLDPALHFLLVTGEVLKPMLVKRWFKKFPGIKLVNAYGPTEASDDITHFIIDKDPGTEQIPIGHPLQNLNIYIVDESMNLVPIGVKGEICVSGIGVGKGYINNEVKTKEVFMEDPFRSQPGVRLYKTGDLGRWLTNGVIEFYGRKDYQVKIRGYRIELEEIENKLMQVTNAREAVVLDRETKGPGLQGIKILCAYLTGVDKTDIPGIKQRLSEYLPQYMIPTQFFVLERLPLTVNGKVDRKELLGLEGDFIGEYIGPRNKIEEKLVEIWAEVLNEDKNKLSIDQDFFELGGHSLKAITLISRIHKEMNVKISLAEIFQHPSIQGISENFINAIKEKYIALEPIEKKDYYEVSSAQRRLYALQQLNLSGTGYNLPIFIILEGNFDKQKMEATFYKLIERYESFRTSFALMDGEPVQIISHPQDIKLDLEYFDLSGSFAGSNAYMPVALELEMKNFIRPFYLGKPPLLKVRLDKINAKKHLLMVDMHHIISDGISHSILVENFVSLYYDANLFPLSFQYKEYAEWQNREKASESVKKQEAYWLAVLGEEVPLLNLPLDYSRPAIQNIEGDAIYFVIDNEKADALKRIAAESGATLYMILLSIFNILLAKISLQEDIIVGTPTGGRRHADLEKIIGMFVNTLPLRNFPHKDLSFSDFFNDVKNRTINAFDNQDYQFEDIVRKVVIKRDTSRNPIFDVMFSYLDFNTGNPVNPGNQDIPVDQHADLKFTSYQRKRKTSKFDITLEISVSSNLSCVFEYGTKLFKKEKIERFIKYWDEIISAVIQNKNILIRDIKISHELVETIFAVNEKELTDFGF
ncbi:MAG TPA: amino acid adenylation domain-containing protein [Candidatus Kapabacteria bacterium]|nr:amino acid adenylation domain-containing protein [Candidatus Kapabacteria bacterium]